MIGAGAAGLGAMEVLQRQGIAFDCFEATDRVGGHWHTDYESLHLITSRDLSGFAGYPMPSSYPVYPSRDQMRDYLEGFATETSVRAHVRFGVRVERITPLGAGGQDGWRVQTDDGETREYSGVLVCNGHLQHQHVPDYPGEFTGRQIHSGAYRSIDDIEGTRVLTVGAGNSGCDLAVDAANARLQSTISIRRGQMFQPKAVFGRPRAEIGWLAKLPVKVNERIARLLSDIVIGPPEGYRGLPNPATRNLNEQPPVVNNLLPYWIQHGRIDVAPGIERLDGRTVHFTDGTSREFDTILWATGFDVTLPFLDAELIRWRDGAPLRTAGLTLPVGVENLYFIGLAAPRGPQLPVYSTQTELVARMLRLEPERRSALAAHFAEIDVPDARIDIVRALWNRQMKDAHRALDAAAKPVPVGR
ncbi:NAD(P)/FAD-dependent oxidoreductase [Solirubrobacter phytolaccae]|uniref:NAD(P)/FAD-dependent oxidoreductase n=1 Tax=Solirubrobacter phytolaccae TaxID=1404360 RepID=A0A9X3S6F8_9ACTN|nr:NAD(P)/FAD-dependent oxidoreductase [Solirubrobacter phytolaccae]MDA0179854.1 NAD(P)/FAD-dependent oxidoreductase [Solirubrobacter phytolaccae]